MSKDNIAIKYTTDSVAVVESNISTGQPEACLPGELVMSAQAGSSKLIAVDANGTGVLVRGVLINENKGSVTVSLSGEGPGSILLNANSVTADKVANNSVTSDKIASPVLITKGGTGQSTQNTAINALLPAQAGNGNKLLVTNGTNTSWVRDSLSLDQLTDVDTSSATSLNDQVLKWDSSTSQWRQRESITTFSDELLTKEAPGREGQIGIGQEYFYLCQGTGKWSRTALQTWNDGAIIRSPASDNYGFTYEPIVARADPYYSNVSLLLHMNGANGSTSFVDSSPSPLSLTRNGNTLIQSTPSLSGGGSVYFDGNGDWINTGNVSAVDVIGSSFTVEAWIYPLTYKAAGMRIAAASGGVAIFNSGLGIHWLMQLDSVGRLVFQWWNGSAAAGLQTTATVSLSTWTHVAASLTGSNLYLAVNGVVQSFIGIGSVVRPGSVPAMTIATIGGEGAGVSTAYQGYMDEVRLTKGVARYTSNFTPLASEFPESGYNRDANFANVSLLLHADGENNSTLFKNYAPTGLPITVVGSPRISTAQSKFGGSSVFFGGSGGYLYMPDNSAFQFGSGEFCIEFWFYAESLSASSPTILSNGNTSFSGGAGAPAWYITVSGSPRKLVMASSEHNPMISSITTIEPQTWYHVAISRQGTSFRMWINFVYQNVAGINTSLNISNNGLLIGRNGWGGASGYWHGYIDDLRITKSARGYTTSGVNIPVQTTAYPDSA